MSPYVSAAEHRLSILRQTIIDVADTNDLPLTIRHLGILADAVTSTLYPADGHADPVLAIGRRTHRRRTGAALSDVERVALRYAANGVTNAEIGRLTGCSENTIKSHMRRAYDKLGARDRTHAVVLALLTGQLTVGDIHQPEAGR